MQAVGQRAMCPHFVLLVAPSAFPGTGAGEGSTRSARLGLVVTKKIGSSPMRSRVKRLCRECFRLWPDLVPDGIDLVVIARDGAAELGLAQVRSEWERARPTLLRRCAAVLDPSAPPVAASPRPSRGEKAR
ncbi:MAG: Ribonuclease protein component [Labilithrix sp.]|nr:Ribonuclease protein component [Labilithrix sp.]